jgi:hypothetical protein
MNDFLYIRTALLVVIGLGIMASALLLYGPSESKRFAEAAKRIVSICSEEAYRPTCYDRELPKLAALLDMEDIFSVTKLVQAQDRGYSYCHVLGHEVAAREVQKDPSQWKTVAARCPTDMCSNGCIHGAFQERFRAETLSVEEAQKLVPEFAQLCEARPGFTPNGITQASCYHALGHLLMYVTNGDSPTSVNLCGQVARKGGGRDYTRVCYDGVFMQTFQPLEPEDIALVKGKQPPSFAEAKLFCGAYDGEVRAACMTESWPLSVDLIRTSKGSYAFCSEQDVPYRERCLRSMYYIVMAQVGFDLARMDEYCAATPSDVRGLCYANAATRLIETDIRNISETVAFCARADVRGEGNACYGELASHAEFYVAAGSPAFNTLCGSLPSFWSEQCYASSSR